MSVHGSEELAAVKRRVRSSTRASLMSDTKWRKLLAALDRPELRLRYCVIKFVGDETERPILRPSRLYPPRPWVDMFEFGPTPLRAIEWLLFPRVADVRGYDRTIPAKRFNQDVDEAARVITSLGRYPAELTERGLLIRGYLAGDSV